MAEPRWLSESEQRTWRAYLAATRLVLEELDRELQRDAGLTHGYYAILVALSEAPGRQLRMAELARATGSSPSRLSHAVSRLEESGWVSRAPCSDDRRGAFALLTEAGLSTLEAAAPGHVDGVRRHLFDRLTPAQLEQLEAISEAILAGRHRPPKPPPIGS